MWADKPGQGPNLGSLWEGGPTMTNVGVVEGLDLASGGNGLRKVAGLSQLKISG